MDTNDPRIIRSLLDLQECPCTADDYADCSSRDDIYACGYLNSSPHSAADRDAATLAHDCAVLDASANLSGSPRDRDADSDRAAR